MAKIPPPPPIASEDPAFNRWLLELTSILSDTGDIDPGSISGYPALLLQVAANTASIASLTSRVGVVETSVSALQVAVSALTARVTSTESAITTLQARNQVFNGAPAPTAGIGIDGDWYAATGVTKHVYVKVAGAWVQIV